MRAVLVLVVVGCAVGCVDVSGPPDPGAGSDWPDPPDPGPLHGLGCKQDTECGAGAVCARTGQCTVADQVGAARIVWTLRGRPADATTCSTTPDLRLHIEASPSEFLSYAPVPCREGKFSIDKLPKTYNSVTLGGIQFSDRGVTAMIDPATGEATIDLAP